MCAAQLIVSLFSIIVNSMKKSITFILLTWSAIQGFSEDNIYRTKLEQAVNTTGFLYKQEVYTVDNIPAFRMDAVKITNLEKFTVISGIKVLHKIQVKKELKTIYNYIDADEIDGLLTSLQYMKTILKSQTIPGNYTEIKYTSKSGFQVSLATILNVSNKLDWNFTVQTNLSSERTLVILPLGDIGKLQDTLEQAKGKL